MNNYLLKSHKVRDGYVIEWHYRNSEKILPWLPDRVFDKFKLNEIGFLILPQPEHASKFETLWLPLSSYYSGYLEYVKDMYLISGIVLKAISETSFESLNDQIDKKIMWEVLHG